MHLVHPGPGGQQRARQRRREAQPGHAEVAAQRGFTTTPAGPGGRGLGLALVRQAVTRHEGTLTVTDAAPGGGAVFEVRLPLRPAPVPAEGGAG